MAEQKELRAKIASRIKSAREMAGLSQGQLARLLEMHRPSLSEIEAGRRKVSVEELTKISKHLGVKVSWLACSEENEGNELDDKIQLAARAMSKMDKKDVDTLFNLLSSIQSKDDTKK